MLKYNTMAGKINSKKKGSKNERDVCKWFKDWTNYEFARVPSSGGLRWSRTTDTAGDIICSDKKHFLRFPFTVECKSYKGITFNDIIKGNKSDVLKFWDQAESDASRAEKIPLLFMRENGMSKGMYYVVVDGLLGSYIHTQGNTHYKGFTSFKVNLPNLVLYVFNSNDFQKVDYKNLRKDIKKLYGLKKKR